MKYIHAIMILLFPFMVYAEGRWRLVSEYHTESEIYFSLRSREPGENYSDNYVFFDEYDFELKFEGGYVLNDKNEYTLQVDLDNPIYLPVSHVGYYLNNYASSINTYEVSFYSFGDDYSFSTIIPVYQDGYQYPYTNTRINRGNIAYANDDSEGYWTTSDSVSVSRIIIKAYPDEGPEPVFVIGDFRLIKTENYYRDIDHPFIQFYFEKSNNTDIREIDCSKTPILFNYYTYTNINRGDWLLLPPDEIDEEEEKEVLKNLFGICIERYPFYREREISETDFYNEYAAIIEDSKEYSLYDFAIKLQLLASKYKDGHFKLEIPGSLYSKQGIAPSRNSPVRLHSMYGNHYLSAVFQEENHLCLLGSKIKAIDNIPIKLLEDSLRRTQGENSISSYINKFDRDQISLTLEHNQQDTIVTIFYKEKFYVPDNFKGRHGEFKELEDRIYYLKLNNFIPGDYIRLLSRAAEMSSAEGLVIDLRGNGGGNSSVAMSIMSLFIDSPQIYSHSEDIFGNITTTVVKPNPHYYYDFPITILIDNGTACASESFAEAFRSSGRAIIMGRNSSGGAYANLHEIRFPSGIVLKTNIFTEKYIVASGRNIENRGIEPDIWLSVGKVEDLFPYNDKCLHDALEYMKYIAARRTNK